MSVRNVCVTFNQASNVLLILPMIPRGCGWVVIGLIGSMVRTVQNQSSLRVAIVARGTGCVSPSRFMFLDYACLHESKHCYVIGGNAK